jgi:hypothetical protein
MPTQAIEAARWGDTDGLWRHHPPTSELIEQPRREYGQGDRNVRTIGTPCKARVADLRERKRAVNRLQQRLRI